MGRVRLIDTIRAKVDAGILPGERPERFFPTHGEEEPCAACGAPIVQSETQWSMGDADRFTHRLHVRCLGLWEAELRRRARLAEPPVRDGRRQVPLREAIVAALRTTVGSGGICIPCLAERTRLDVKLTVAFVVDFGKRVARVQGVCPACRQRRLLVRL